MEARKKKGFLDYVELVACILFVVFTLYTAIFGALKGTAQKAAHLGMIFLIAYIGQFKKDKGKIALQIADIVGMLLSARL